MSSKYDEANGSAADQSADPPTADPARAAAAGSDPARAPPHEWLQAIEQRVRWTSISAAWVGMIVAIVAIVVLVLLLIFILENLRDVTVTYFGASGQLPIGVALLSAAIGGALFVAMVGVARLTELRLNARRRRRCASTHPRSKQNH